MAWLVIGESSIGTSHRARSNPCQDAFRFKTSGSAGEWLAIAVADGAGSASYSQVGATLVCDELIRRVEMLLPSAISHDEFLLLFRDVREAVFAEANCRALPAREMACTVLLALLTNTGSSFAQIGDGAIVIREDSGYRTVFWPEAAEYANETNFLTDESFAETIRVEIYDRRIEEIAVFTDGLQRLCLDFTARVPHPAFFEPVFAALRGADDAESLFGPLRDFLDSPRINDRTDDDKTLVLALRQS